MAVKKLTKDLDFISSLANQPTESAEELKKSFDKAGDTIKDYINDSLIPDIDNTYLPKTGGTVSGNLKTTGALNVNGSGTFGGNFTVSGRETVKGGLSINSKGTELGIELYGDTPYIDFHYNNTATDWTTRIMESSLATMSLIAKNGVDFKTTYTDSSADIFAKIYKSGNTVVFGGTNTNEGVAFRSKSNVNTGIPIQASKFLTVSSKRYKENIRDMSEEEANKVLDIDVKIFDYINKENGTNVAGVIAEDIEKVIPEIVSYKEIDGKNVPDSVDYIKLVPYLLKEVQMLKKEIKTLNG